MKLVSKVKGMVSDVKQHWNTPKPGRLVPYKEVAAYGFGGMGIYWATILSSQIGLSANNFLVGHAINLKPVDLQIMLNIANLIGFAITFVRSYFYDNINSKDGKIRPFLKWSLIPLAVLSTAFVWMPYERMEYYQKVIVVEIFYLAIAFFSPYVTEGFYMLAQVMSSDSNERTDVMSIGQLLMSFAPTLSNLFVPYLAMLTGGMTDLRTYRIIYPIISIIGLPLAFLTYSGTRERIIKPKDEPFSVTFKDAIVTISKNKYYWIINIAGWLGFLESASGVILTWTFVYGMPEKQQHMGLATTIISNGALWAMLSAPFIIRKLGKRKLLIGCNVANVILLSLLYPFYKNMIAVIVISYINNFFSVFYNIYFYGLNADMKDYHQYKFRERVDGMFAVVGTIGTVLGFGTGMVIPVLYQRMGLKDDYSVLYDATIRENLFEVLIIASIAGAILNVIPYFFYDMTEQKHAGIVKVLKLRAMFGDYAAGNADPEQLREGIEIIESVGTYTGKEAVINDYIREELDQYSSPVFLATLSDARELVAAGIDSLRYYNEDTYKEIKSRVCTTKEEKEIRKNALERAKSLRKSATLFNKHYPDGIIAPDARLKHELHSREVKGMKETIRLKKEISQFKKTESIYNNTIKPFVQAERLIKEYEGFSNLDLIRQSVNESSEAEI